MTKEKPLFEHDVCGRCGGTGSYSYCTMYGSRCFGCSGSGYKLTKRGRAAQNFINDLRRLPVSELSVGDTILEEGFNAGSFSMPTRWVKIEKIEAVEGNPEKVTIYTSGSTFSEFSIDSKFRKAFTAEEKNEQRKLALEYQAKLTKMGKLMKKYQESV